MSEQETLIEKRRAAGRLGGLATVRKYGSDHMREIGKRGAAVTWQRYNLLPLGIGGYAMVDRNSRKVVAWR